jgi:3-deoxy-D-manno-octulosonic-acid transferase
MYFWYKIFTYLFYPVAPIYLFFRRIRKKEDNIRYIEKLSKTHLPRGDDFLIWLHVASVGEAMSVLPLIDSLIKDPKINKILITSITLSSGKILKRRFEDNDKVVHQFLPLDIIPLINKFLNHWKPGLAIFIDSEIWPNLILKVKSKNIPLILLNARITEKTFNRWKLFIKSAKKIFSMFDLCIASNKDSEKFLDFLGAKNIKNYGNLKFSSLKNDLNKKLDLFFVDKIKNRKVWCAASTHEGEENICGKSHLFIKKKYSNILTIIIPRHINRVQSINRDLKKLNLNIILSSELDKVDINTDIILVNSYGEALKYYNISKYVFLGKSLIKSLMMDSGQNPIEPARLGCKVFHGPYVSNFVEIYDYLKSLDVSKIVNNSEQLSLSLVEEFGKDREKNLKISDKIDQYGQNIINNVILELKKYI